LELRESNATINTRLEESKNRLEEEKLRLLADPDYTRRGGEGSKPKPIREGDKFVAVELPNGTKLDYKEGKLFTTEGKEWEPELLD